MHQHGRIPKKEKDLFTLDFVDNQMIAELNLYDLEFKLQLRAEDELWTKLNIQLLFWCPNKNNVMNGL